MSFLFIRGVLKSATTTHGLSVVLDQTVSLMKLGDLVFAVYMFKGIISCLWLFLLMSIKCPCIYLLFNFSLKFILSNIRIAECACFNPIIHHLTKRLSILLH